MTKITLVGKGGKEITLHYPTDPTECKYSDWLEFNYMCTDVLPKSREVEDNGAAFLQGLGRALNIFNPDVDLLAEELYPDVPTYIECLATIADGMHKMLLASPPQDIDPMNYRVEYKGDWYKISGAALNSVEVGERYKVTALEAIEFLTLESALMKANEKAKTDLEKVENQYAYTRMQLAVLLRKVGEVLPTDPLDMEQFIKERGQHFADIPMSVMRDVAAFFFRSITGLGNTRVLPTSLNRQPRPQPKAKSPRMKVV